MVTNPGTRDWTVIASQFATLNEMYGNRTICGIGRGDSALRVLGLQPQSLAELRESVGVIRGLANGREGDAARSGAAVRLGAGQPAGGVGGRVRAEGPGPDR